MCMCLFILALIPFNYLVHSLLRIHIHILDIQNHHIRMLDKHHIQHLQLIHTIKHFFVNKLKIPLKIIYKFEVPKYCGFAVSAALKSSDSSSSIWSFCSNSGVAIASGAELIAALEHNATKHKTKITIWNNQTNTWWDFSTKKSKWPITTVFNMIFIILFLRKCVKQKRKKSLYLNHCI